MAWWQGKKELPPQGVRALLKLKFVVPQSRIEGLQRHFNVMMCGHHKGLRHIAFVSYKVINSKLLSPIMFQLVTIVICYIKKDEI